MKHKIFKDGELVNIIEASGSFCESYCEKHGYTYEAVVETEPEEEPTQLDRIEAQATYTAMMTDTLLEV